MIISYRDLKSDEIPMAIKLSERVFIEFEASHNTPEGIDEFVRSINDKEYIKELRFFGTFYDGKLVGVIATRNKGSHIALFFIDKDYQKKGVGRRLMNHVLERTILNEITVNSSIYAHNIYKHFGFVDTDGKQKNKGVVFYPMIYRRRIR